MDLFGGSEGLFFHDPFDLTALAINGVELAGEFKRLHIVIGCQATDPEAHIGQTTGGVNTRAKREAQIKTAGGLGIAGRDGKQGPNARLHQPAAHPVKPSSDE